MNKETFINSFKVKNPTFTIDEILWINKITYVCDKYLNTQFKINYKNTLSTS